LKNTLITPLVISSLLDPAESLIVIEPFSSTLNLSLALLIVPLTFKAPVLTVIADNEPTFNEDQYGVVQVVWPVLGLYIPSDCHNLLFEVTVGAVVLHATLYPQLLLDCVAVGGTLSPFVVILADAVISLATGILA